MPEINTPESGTVSGLFSSAWFGDCDACDVQIHPGDDIGMIRDETFCATCYRRSGAGNL